MIIADMRATYILVADGQIDVGDAFTIRGALQGALHDIAEESGFRCVYTENLIRDLVSLLASYREEDVPLFPEVYVLSDLQDLRTLAPGLGSHRIGSLVYNNDIAAKVLKSTAGLAADGWAVYVAKVGEKEFEYGVFRSQRHSFATSAEETMRDLGDHSPLIVVRNRGHLTVELMNTSGRSFPVSLTISSADSSSFSTHVDALARQACADFQQDGREQFSPYLSRLLTRQLQRCHGTLIAVIDKTVESVPDAMSDGVWFEPVIDLASCHTNACLANTAESLSDLQAAECLLAGMLNSDGIVVLGTDGTIRGFRVFLAPTEEEKRELDERGGGRRRTFGLMKLRVADGKLRAAFIRSQDGETDCHGASHD